MKINKIISMSLILCSSFLTSCGSNSISREEAAQYLKDSLSSGYVKEALERNCYSSTYYKITNDPVTYKTVEETDYAYKNALLNQWSKKEIIKETGKEDVVKSGWCYEVKGEKCIIIAKDNEEDGKVYSKVKINQTLTDSLYRYYAFSSENGAFPLNLNQKLYYQIQNEHLSDNSYYSFESNNKTNCEITYSELGSFFYPGVTKYERSEISTFNEYLLSSYEIKYDKDNYYYMLETMEYFVSFPYPDLDLFTKVSKDELGLGSYSYIEDF